MATNETTTKPSWTWPKILTVVGLGILILVFVANEFVLDGRPERHIDDAMHFKYGSIGSDNLRRGFPYRIWQILPEMFPQYLPKGKPHTYEAFGLTVDGRDHVDRPIGFSKRWHLGFGDVIGINCAFCHVSTVRTRVDSHPKIVLGMPANTVDPEAFFRFLFAVVDDPNFTTEKVLDTIEKKAWMGHWEKFIHRIALIPQFKKGVQNMKHRFEFLNRNPRTPFGPGRVDTWAYYKVASLQECFWLMEKLPEFRQPYLEMDPGTLAGLADFPAIWRQKAPEGGLHWDGNNTEPMERNITAAMGAGVTPATVDRQSLERIATWFESDTYPVQTYDDLAKTINDGHSVFKETIDKGRILFKDSCYDCHGVNGKRTKEIVAIDEIQTDRSRLDSFTEPLKTKLNEISHLSEWKFENYRKTNGYANLLLTGIWLRAPYLHNGSVPTLWHLLQEPSKRPTEFCRGNDLYDWKNVGFEWDPAPNDCQGFFKYDTKLPGNGNGGHSYGTELPDPDKWALVEYMKTL